jgi:uncharacterized protein YegL
MKFVCQKTNKYHKPVVLLLDSDNTLLRKKNMLQFIVPSRNLPVNLIIALDESGSMTSLKTDAINALNSNLAKFREESNKNGIPITLQLATFNGVCSEFTSYTDFANSNFSEISPASYNPNGSTALYDTVAKCLSLVEPSKRNIVLIITDGEDVCSKIPAGSINVLMKASSKNLTALICGPDTWHFKNAANSMGFESGNITTWETTKKGVETLSQTINRGTTNLFASYSMGATQSHDFFQPDLNIQPSLLNTNLDDVTNKYNEYLVSSKIAISDFVQLMTGKPYRVGSSFYPLTKKITLQSHKDIILKDSNGKLHTGDGIRSLLRIPEGGSIELLPSNNNNGYTVFIKSTSHNRNLIPGTTLLIAK